MQKIADIYINIPVKSISQAYSYIIPEKFDIVKIGCRVLVPFGNRLLEGFIIALYSEEEFKNKAHDEKIFSKLKEIADIIDIEPWFTIGMYKTAKWLANFYLCSIGEAMRLFIPGKNSVKIRPIYNIAHKADEKSLDNMAVEFKNLYEYIKAYKDADLLTLRRSFGSKEILMPLLDKLLAKNLITRSYTYDLQAKKIYVNYAVLNISTDSETVEKCLAKLKRKNTQRRALKYLIHKNSCSFEELTAEKISSAIIKALESENFVRIEKRQILRDSYKNMVVNEIAKRKLTTEQEQAIAKIEANTKVGKNKFLLFGVTGSGKTQIYIEISLKMRAKGKQVLILVPEIVLTGQLVMSFKEYFKDDVAVIHSRLSISERNDTFFRIRTQKVGVIIGARSAIFAPFEDLGLIVMDEEHDSSYKQDESPRYHSHDIVEEMTKIYNAVLIMGSATPSLESFYKATKNNPKYTLLTMKERIDNIPLPQIEGVDMREELRRGNRKIISYKLQELISKTLAKKQQLIIMLNRRGFSTFVMCRSCGHVIKCKQCNLSMVYHRRGILQCHHCDIIESVPDICPKCSSRYIKFFGTGTEKLEEELNALFPTARIIRLDRDTTGKKFAHQNILKQFRQGHYDILLGTQMVAKGHDIPNVTGVGIISADSSLNIPDFRASERCFDLITQTAGRAGRGQEKGKVVVQTYNLEHYAVQYGIKQDYLSFYQEEIAMRKIMYFPPFSNLIKLVIQQNSEENALKKANYIKAELQKYIAKDGVQAVKIEILGPAPAVISQFKGIYRFNLLIKTNDLALTRQYLQKLNLDKDLSTIIDINPININ